MPNENRPMNQDPQDRRRRAAAATIVAMTLGLALPGIAPAASNRTFVSGTGADSGDCARPSPPCRTFAYALTQTNPGGEIIALDSGGFGSSLTIDREITITAARGVNASMTATSGTLITVNAPAGADVVLEHLNLLGRGASKGIQVDSGGLRIRDVSISRFVNRGIETGAGSDPISVIDSRISRISFIGLLIEGPASGPRRPFIVKDSLFERFGSTGSAGVRTGQGTRGTIADSVIRRSAGRGIQIQSGAAPATVNIDDVTLTDNLVALDVTSFGTLAQATIGRSTVADNDNAFLMGNPDARLFSYGDNRIEDNGTAFSPTATIPRG